MIIHAKVKLCTMFLALGTNLFGRYLVEHDLGAVPEAPIMKSVRIISDHFMSAHSEVR